MTSSPRLGLRSPGRSRPASAEINITELLRYDFGAQGLDQGFDKIRKDGDENLSKKDRDSFLVRSLKNSGSRNRLVLSGIFGDKIDGCNFLPIERVAERGSTSDLSDENPATPSDPADSDKSRPYYFNCSETGRRMVRMQFDVSGFGVKDIKVKLMGRKLVIAAHHRENDSGKRSKSESCRKIRLPDDIDPDRLTCKHNDHVIIAEAPVIARDLGYNKHRFGSLLKVESLNVPNIRHTDMGRMMQMMVELGKIFRPDDVVVKLKGHDRLVITAQRQETNENSSLNALVTREFNLPDRIYPHSLKAGLTQDGVLNVTALVQDISPLSEKEVIVKTENSKEPDHVGENNNEEKCNKQEINTNNSQSSTK